LLELYRPGDEQAWLRTFRFSVELRPRYCETDALGHVSNTVYTAYLELGRLQYFRAAGDPEGGPFAFAHVTAELHLRCVAACFYDEAWRVWSKLTALGRSGATMDQALAGEGAQGLPQWDPADAEALGELVLVQGLAGRQHALAQGPPQQVGNLVGMHGTVG